MEVTTIILTFKVLGTNMGPEHFCSLWWRNYTLLIKKFLLGKNIG